MDVRSQFERERRKKLPLLSAFGTEGEVEDGLTDSRRTVFRAVPFSAEEGEPVAAPPLLAEPEPVTDPFSMAWVARGQPPREERVYPAVQRAGRFLGFVGRCVSRRVANEEIGDALERLDRVAAAGAPAWVLYLMAGMSALWVATHSVQELALRFAGKVRKVFSGKRRENEER